MMRSKKKTIYQTDKQSKKLPVFGNCIMEWTGNREIIIEGVNGILEYNDSNIRINTDNMIISFSGRGLTIECLTDSSLVIKGFITSSEFLC